MDSTYPAKTIQPALRCTTIGDHQRLARLDCGQLRSSESNAASPTAFNAAKVAEIKQASAKQVQMNSSVIADRLMPAYVI